MHDETLERPVDNSAHEQYIFYSGELEACQTRLKKWHKKADKIVDRFLGRQAGTRTHSDSSDFQLNLFHSNIVTLSSMLYGNVPRIDVSRRYADADDDVARVAAETLERLLNLDVVNNGDEIESTLRSALLDRLLGGLGTARVRYTMETEQVVTEFGTEERLISEDAPLDYVFWGDMLWSWARNFSDVRWLAYRSYMSKEDIRERFGDEAAEGVPLKKQKVQAGDESRREPDADSPWMRGEIWEIWDKDTKQVLWMAFGYDKILEVKDDPLQLNNFFPSPAFFLANPTTSLYAPTPDFALAQDLYNEIDNLQLRISVITEAVKVVGVYDSAADGIKSMFKQGLDNDLIPVDNWALFAEKGGIRGQIDWVPITDIVNALDKLRELRSENIGLLQQITGMSDIMRGGLDSAYEGVGQSEMKAKFGSIRVQALQDQFATFASELMQIKAEIISRHFSPETIVKRANMQHSSDADLLPQAIQLIKDPNETVLRTTIRPESVAMIDYAQLKNERTGYLNALSTFMQSAAPLIESDPAAKPFLLQMLQWGLSGFKGASEIEGVLDKAIDASKKAAENPDDKPDPEQQKMQQQQQLAQQKMQMEMQKIQAKSQADMQIREQDKQADIETAMATHQGKLAEINAALQAALAEIDAKMQADIMVEQAQSEANAIQSARTADSEIRKDAVSMQLDMEKETAKTALKIEEIRESASAKIKESRAKPTPSSTDT